MLTYLFAVLGAAANAISSVLQRKSNRDQPGEENLSLRLIGDLLHRPLWFGGIAAVTAGFLLQATALANGQLAVVEPLLALELPMTLLLAAAVFHTGIRVRDWAASAAMTIGLAGLLFFLSPTQGHAGGVGWVTWLVGAVATLVLIGGLVVLARRQVVGPRRGALLGVATGAAFGLTAALMKGMTLQFQHGLLTLLTSWQLYAMIFVGVGSMFLLQSALNAGRLLAAQPGITLTDPLVSILWGIFAFGEQVRGGLFILLDVIAGALIVAAVIGLTRSPVLRSDQREAESAASERYEPAR